MAKAALAVRECKAFREPLAPAAEAVRREALARRAWPECREVPALRELADQVDHKEQLERRGPRAGPELKGQLAAQAHKGQAAPAVRRELLALLVRRVLRGRRAGLAPLAAKGLLVRLARKALLVRAVYKGLRE